MSKELKNADIVEIFDNFTFMKQQGEPLHEKDSRFLMNMILAVKKDGVETIDAAKDENSKKMKEFIDNGVCAIIRLRLKAVGYTISDYALIFASLSEPSAGVAVMYSAYFAYIAKNKGIKDIKLEDLCMDCFPMGIPSDEVLHKYWEKQKVNANQDTKQYQEYKTGKLSTDNLLDFGECWRNLKLETNG